MNDLRKKKIEFGDFQTPDHLANAVCKKLVELGLQPDIVIEPSCGVGSFIIAAATVFQSTCKIHGFEINPDYLNHLSSRLPAMPQPERITLTEADFFGTHWPGVLQNLPGTILVLGNFPWVTNATQGNIGGFNLPQKSNFQHHIGLDAITGKANFDISEWMLLEVLRWFTVRAGDIAMLVKTAVARKILAHAERQKLPVKEAKLFSIDAKKDFNAAVDACLLVIRFGTDKPQATYDYLTFKDLQSDKGQRVGHRDGFTVGDLDAFEAASFLVGECPQKWRSGVKHDAAAIMELTRIGHTFCNGYGEQHDLEMNCLFPLLKGSDIGSGKPWREKFVLITQHFVGESTDSIREKSPKTWCYLETHAAMLDARGSSIYKKNPPFSIFGIGDYAFRPWKIAICGLYKSLKFRLIAPIEGKPAMFDDTVYYLSFNTEQEASEALGLLLAKPSLQLLSSLIFWDEKRPIKTAILNVLDWSRLGENARKPHQLELALPESDTQTYANA